MLIKRLKGKCWLMLERIRKEIYRTVYESEQPERTLDDIVVMVLDLRESFVDNNKPRPV